jgi:peptidoglycan/LPS O-acetylase OafA/YrhL
MPIKILLGGMVLNQIFFAISGFLQATLFLDYITKQTKFDANLLWKSIFHRYIRIVPVYGFFILLDSTLLVRMQDGPIWPRIAETERYFCRKNWWTNMLFINNYVNANEPVSNRKDVKILLELDKRAILKLEC